MILKKLNTLSALSLLTTQLYQNREMYASYLLGNDKVITKRRKLM